MLEKKQINTIKETIEEFFKKMTIETSSVEVSMSSLEKKPEEVQDLPGEDREVIDIEIKIVEPQILIGQGGQTLFEIQRLLKTIINKKLQNSFYLNLDINDYKKQKIEYLKNIAKDLADQVSINKEEKVLLPMSSYERRVIHAELAQRTDVITESHGEGFNRHIVIKAK
ncbi:MAG: R3H domain-containing nucleic acid-binding protein [Candidatus Staskawiczbacteria bacterium]